MKWRPVQVQADRSWWSLDVLKAKICSSAAHFNTINKLQTGVFITGILNLHPSWKTRPVSLTGPIGMLRTERPEGNMGFWRAHRCSSSQTPPTNGRVKSCTTPPGPFTWLVAFEWDMQKVKPITIRLILKFPSIYFLQDLLLLGK